MSLTPAGRQLVRRVLKRHGVKVQAVLAGLNDDERRTLHGLLERLGSHLETIADRDDAAGAA